MTDTLTSSGPSPDSPFADAPTGQPVESSPAASSRPGPPTHGTGRWPGAGKLAAIWIGLLGAQLLASWSGDELVVENHVVLAWTVIVAAGLCVIAAGWLLVLAHRRNQAELGVLGLVFMAISIFPLVHGITTPGVWYGANATTTVSILIAPALAAVFALPVLFRNTSMSRSVMRSWRAWTAGGLLVVSNLATFLLAEPNLIPAPGSRSALSLAAGVLSVGVFAVLSLRHARLAWAGGGERSMAIAISFAWIGAAQLVWVGKTPYSIGFWLSHLLDTAGVAIGIVAALAVSREQDGLRDVLRPLTVHDPIEAFTVGLDPVVRARLSTLDRRDPELRDHSVRTASLALGLGRRVGLAPHELRDVGVAALLHDVGQLWLPDDVVRPTRLPGIAQVEVFRTHVARAERSLASSAVTRSVIPIVRAHHEHVDGTGYPGALRGSEIPKPARILAVADAFDEFTHPRVGAAMSPDAALTELAAQAGRRFDADLVDELTEMVRDGHHSGATVIVDELGLATAE